MAKLCFDRLSETCTNNPEAQTWSGLSVLSGTNI